MAQESFSSVCCCGSVGLAPELVSIFQSFIHMNYLFTFMCMHRYDELLNVGASESELTSQRLLRCHPAFSLSDSP